MDALRPLACAADWGWDPAKAAQSKSEKNIGIFVTPQDRIVSDADASFTQKKVALASTAPPRDDRSSMSNFTRRGQDPLHQIRAAAERAFVRGADIWAARWPFPLASSTQVVQRARIVAHRGDTGNGAIENTLAAFDRADLAEVWGLEMDMRLTRDGNPVIAHDPDLQRVFGVTAKIAELSTSELKALAPSAPTLEEIVARYGGRRHLMLEAKADAFAIGTRGTSEIRRLLAGLEPGRDYHVLALDPVTFDAFPWAPPEAFVPVATANVVKLSALSLKQGWGGLAGHFSLLRPPRRVTHRTAGQSIGVGQIASARCLAREITRGADWFFTDYAVQANTWLDALQQKRSS